MPPPSPTRANVARPARVDAYKSDDPGRVVSVINAPAPILLCPLWIYSSGPMWSKGGVRILRPCATVVEVGGAAVRGL
ncbi:hypothetical protein Psuf_025790 [Phytohabitans suffuscus]|uniref:Uncharacterized protein n=1 Tax=Phytohabitans suffuscus TaxID=624315 RepID=A0A6F8YGP9_9ACTN|nr:hypothetical protein Psuf_025790 [Phytohabitans suffuscus]